MVINGYTELMQQREIADAGIQRYVEQIQEAGKRAAGVTRQLLAFSRQQILETRVLDLNRLLTELGKMLTRLLGEDVAMEIVPAPQLGRVRADPVQIEQVIMNLAVNARDAMPKGGKLVLETANVELDEEYCRTHKTIQPGQFVMLAVSDTGSGMDAETQARIFEPFFTTKEVGKGTGLGLATVYGIVKQSGGSIWVYSEVGRGTTFKIYFPRVEEQAEVAVKQPALKGARGTETVLVVEDEAGLRAAVCEYLKLQGYTVLMSGSGDEALALAEARREPIHLLLTDLVMPGIQGPELAARMVEIHPEIRTLYMSGYTDRTLNVKELGPGAILLQKPFSFSSLAEKLRSALTGSLL
jgi:CheY-like chemotaxis protein